MSKESEQYYKNISKHSVGKFYINYPVKVQKIAKIFDDNYKEMEFFRKHIKKDVPFAYPEYMNKIRAVLAENIGKTVYIIKSDGHIQRANIVKFLNDDYYVRKVYDIKFKKYTFINHQIKKVLAIYDEKGNTIYEYFDFSNSDEKVILDIKEKINELTEINR